MYAESRPERSRERSRSYTISDDSYGLLRICWDFLAVFTAWRAPSHSRILGKPPKMPYSSTWLLLAGLNSETLLAQLPSNRSS
jgi:hypothetical protein